MADRSESRARRLWRALEPVHAVTYFAPESQQACTALGTRGYWMSYFALRAAPLGPAPAELVTALFYNFHPGLVAPRGARRLVGGHPGALPRPSGSRRSTRPAPAARRRRARLPAGGGGRRDRPRRRAGRADRRSRAGRRERRPELAGSAAPRALAGPDRAARTPRRRSRGRAAHRRPRSGRGAGALRRRPGSGRRLAAHPARLVGAGVGGAAARPAAARGPGRAPPVRRPPPGAPRGTRSSGAPTSSPTCPGPRSATTGRTGWSSWSPRWSPRSWPGTASSPVNPMGLRPLVRP